MKFLVFYSSIVKTFRFGILFGLLNFSGVIWILALVPCFCALQQHAPIEKKFVRNFEPKNVLKTEWFDWECQQLMIKKQNSLRSYRSKAQAIIGQSTSFYIIKWANWLEVNKSIIQKIVFHFSALSNKNGNILTKLEVHVLATIELQFYETPSVKW